MDVLPGGPPDDGSAGPGLIVNRVAASAVETVDLASVVGPLDVAALDLAPLMHRGLVVRERDFRAAVAALDLAPYAGRHVALVVPDGALVPAWAPMVVAARLSETAASVAVSGVEARRASLAAERVRAHDWSAYAGRAVVLKGCGTGEVPLDAFAQATVALQGVAAKVMFGEPCSAVPVWRRPAPADPGARPAARPVKPSGPPRPASA
jgi:hypothetical protein